MKSKFLTLESSVLREYLVSLLRLETGQFVVYPLMDSQLRMVLSQIRLEDGLCSLTLKDKPTNGSV